VSLLFLYDIYEDTKKLIQIMDASYNVKSRWQVAFKLLVTNFLSSLTAGAAFAKVCTIHVKTGTCIFNLIYQNMSLFL